MDLSATRHTAVWSRVELPRPPSSMLSGCLALLTFCSSNCCVQVYRSCVCQCTGGRHHTVIVCWCSPPILCLRLKPLHCGFSPRVYCFFFFFLYLMFGAWEERRRRCSFSQVQVSRGFVHLQPLVASMLSAEPCTEDASVSA